MISFQPKTEAQIREGQLAPDGDYDFTVIKAEEMTSAKGNPMIKLKLGIFNGEAMRWHVTDFLVAAMEAKLRHFSETTGLLARYERGELAADDCTGRSGRVRLVIESDEMGKYPDKNSVKDYLVPPPKTTLGPKPTPAPAAAEMPPGAAEIDDVPF